MQQTVSKQAIEDSGSLLNALSFKQSAIVFIAISLWVMAFIAVLSTSQITSSIIPTTWLLSSSTLLLFWLIKKFQANIRTTLLIHGITLSWIVLSLLVAVVFWYFDQWLFQTLSSTSLEGDIRSWQKQLQNYHIGTVFISSVLLAPIFEELVFRGLVLQALQKKITIWLAILVSSLLFALIHWSWPEFISLLLVGCLYALLVNRSKTILTAILAHITHNGLTFWQYASF